MKLPFRFDFLVKNNAIIIRIESNYLSDEALAIALISTFISFAKLQKGNPVYTDLPQSHNLVVSTEIIFPSNKEVLNYIEIVKKILP